MPNRVRRIERLSRGVVGSNWRLTTAVTLFGKESQRMLERDALVDWLDNLLRPEDGPIDDASNNGLQVEGKPEVERVVGGVDACRQLFERAAAERADFVLVHHGLSWGGGLKRLTGLAAGRVRTLFAHEISLYASHLPLDMHPKIGHNAVLARKLDIEAPEPFFPYNGREIGFAGDLPEVMSAGKLGQRVDDLLGGSCTLVGERKAEIQRVGVVSGGGADAVSECPGAGCDCLITGEMKHSEFHTAAELGVCVIAAGHYRTEMVGVKALLERMRAELPVESSFISLPTQL